MQSCPLVRREHHVSFTCIPYHCADSCISVNRLEPGGPASRGLGSTYLSKARDEECGRLGRRQSRSFIQFGVNPAANAAYDFSQGFLFLNAECISAMLGNLNHHDCHCSRPCLKVRTCQIVPDCYLGPGRLIVPEVCMCNDSLRLLLNSRELWRRHDAGRLSKPSAADLDAMDLTCKAWDDMVSKLHHGAD